MNAMSAAVRDAAADLVRADIISVMTRLIPFDRSSIDVVDPRTRSNACGALFGAAGFVQQQHIRGRQHQGELSLSRRAVRQSRWRQGPTAPAADVVVSGGWMERPHCFAGPDRARRAVVGVSMAGKYAGCE